MRVYYIIIGFILGFALVANGQDSLRIAKELEKSKSIYMQQPDSALYYAQNVVAWADEIEADWQKAWGLKMIGVYYQMVNQPDSAIHFFRGSYDIFLALKDTTEIGKSQLSLTQMYLQTGDFDKALNYSFLAKDNFEALGRKDYLNRIYDAIGQAYSFTEDYGKALPYFHKAYQTTIALKDTFNTAAALANLATIHTYMGNRDSVDYYYERAMPVLSKVNHLYAQANLVKTVGNLDRKEGLLDAAAQKLSKAIELFEIMQNPVGLAQSYYHYGEVLDDQKEYAKAIVAYEKALDGAMSVGLKMEAKDAAAGLKRLYGLVGQYEEAYAKSSLYDTLLASFMDLEKQEAIARLQEEFQSKEREQKIDLQEARLERNQLFIIGLIMAAALLIAVLLLLRIRARKEKEIMARESQLNLREAEVQAVIHSQEKERNRFARDLHDGFGQMISVLKLNLGQLKEVEARDLKKREAIFSSGEKVINEMYAELRNICFDLMPQTLVKHGLKAALEELADRVGQNTNISCEVLVFELEDRLPELLEIALFRIVQEWVNNVLKYAEASELVIQITREDEELTMTIEDNGKGFDPEIFYNGKGNGWTNIQTRLNQSKGSFELDSREGVQGSMVTVNLELVPVKKIPTSTEAQIRA